MLFTQPISRNAKLYPARAATHYNGRTRTWAELADRVARFAAALKGLGTEADRVAILSLNSDRYFEFYYAAPWAGMAMVPLNIRWSLKENAYSLNDAGVTVLLVDDVFAEMARGLVKECDTVKTLVYIGDGDTPEGMLNYETLLEAKQPIPAHRAAHDDMVGIFYTGGTTGFPKGVMLSHKNLFCSTVALVSEAKMLGADIHQMAVAPMFHLACGAASWSCGMSGVTQTILPMFDPQAVVDTIAKQKITQVLLVPTMISMLLESGVLQGADISSLERITYGASPMPEGTLRKALELMPHVGYRQGYGQTECAPMCSALAPEYHTFEGPYAGKTRSAGRPMVNVDVEIRDEGNQPLPMGEVGQIAIQGGNVMLGYWNNPEATAKTVVDGWLLTGDAGYMDEDGFIFLVDRVKDMIVSGGENVYSAEVENAISNHPAVAQAVVIGIPSEQWGEAVHAIVRTSADVTESQIIEHCRKSIAGYKVPRSVEFREEEFPITGAGKIQKNVLREPFWKDHDRNIN